MATARPLALLPATVAIVTGLRPFTVRARMLDGELQRVRVQGRTRLILPRPNPARGFEIGGGPMKWARPLGTSPPKGPDRQLRLVVSESTPGAMTPPAPTKLGPARHG